MSLLWAVLLCLVLAAGWLLTLLGLPGNWIMVAATALYAWLAPAPVDSRLVIGWWVVAALLGLALVGEIIELGAGAIGVAQVGGSRRAALLALVGSIVGGAAGIFVGVPIPVVGSLAGAVVFGGLGALAGAMLGESWKGRGLGASWQVGKGAFWARLLGTLAKTLVASVMVGVVLAALVL